MWARMQVPLKKLAELKMRKEQIAELQKANAGKDEIISLNVNRCWIQNVLLKSHR